MSVTKPDIIIDSSVSKEVRKSIDIPTPNKPPLTLDQKTVNKWLNDDKIVSLDREARKFLVQSYEHIDWERFVNETEGVIDKFNELEIPKYHFLWDQKPHGSKRWMYELFKKKLEGETVGFGYNPPMDKLIDFAKQTDVYDFLLLDDAVYTGEQLGETVLAPLWNKLAEREKNGEKFPTFKVTIIVPFTSKETPGIYTMFWEPTERMNVRFIYGHQLPAIADVIGWEKVQTLRKHQGRVSFEDDDSDNLRNNPVHYTQVLATFAHKVPDNTSAARPLFRAWGIDAGTKREPYKIGKTNYYQLEEKEFQLRDKLFWNLVR